MSRFDQIKGGGYVLKWYGDEFKGKLRTELRKRLSQVGSLVVAEAKSLLSVPGSTQRTKTTTRGGKKFRKRSKMFNAAVSDPGDPPRLQRGRLRRSINKVLKNLKVRIRAQDPKAHLLELGTKNMQPRPFLRAAIANKRAEIRSILSKFMR
jgi:HK97 gp10 family phage protein